jgi:hypothetical protein
MPRASRPPIVHRPTSTPHGAGARARKGQLGKPAPALRPGLPSRMDLRCPSTYEGDGWRGRVRKHRYPGPLPHRQGLRSLTSQPLDHPQKSRSFRPDQHTSELTEVLARGAQREQLPRQGVELSRSGADGEVDELPGLEGRDDGRLLPIPAGCYYGSAALPASEATLPQHSTAVYSARTDAAPDAPPPKSLEIQGDPRYRSLE